MLPYHIRVAPNLEDSPPQARQDERAPIRTKQPLDRRTTYFGDCLFFSASRNASVLT